MHVPNDFSSLLDWLDAIEGQTLTVALTPMATQSYPMAVFRGQFTGSRVDGRLTLTIGGSMLMLDPDRIGGIGPAISPRAVKVTTPGATIEIARS